MDKYHIHFSSLKLVLALAHFRNRGRIVNVFFLLQFTWKNINKKKLA